MVILEVLEVLTQEEQVILELQEQRELQELLDQLVLQLQH
jgi:hypothetical protein